MTFRVYCFFELYKWTTLEYFGMINRLNYQNVAFIAESIYNRHIFGWNILRYVELIFVYV